MRSWWVIVGLELGVASVAYADERALERFDAHDGLRTADVTALAQDATGFVWVGTNGGLARFDGETFEPWAVAQIGGRVSGIAPGRDGTYVAEAHARVWHVDADDPNSAEPVAGPDGFDILQASDLAVADDDALWVVVDGRALRRSLEGAWTEPYVDCFDDDPVQFLALAVGQPPHIATWHGVWRGGDGCPERVADISFSYDLWVTPAGEIHVLEGSGAWRRIAGDEVTVVHAPVMQGRSFAQRGADVWAAHSDQITVRHADGRVESWSSDAGMARGGPLLVDHEGSLWVATGTALLHYFEPETIVTSVPYEGVPVGLLSLTDLGDVVLATSWYGGATIDADAAAPRVLASFDEHRFGFSFHDRACRDADGAAWGIGYRGEGWMVWKDGGWNIRPTVRPLTIQTCTESRDGRVWLATEFGVYVTGPGDPTYVADLPRPATATIHRMYEDDAGRLWAASGRRVCSCDLERESTWACDELPKEVVHLTGFATTQGVLLATTATDGLYARRAEGWRRLPISDDLVSRALYAVRPSRRGGVWVVGSGIAVRIRVGDDAPGGFEVVERLGQRHGLVDEGASDVIERPDGGLWLATASGLTRIPAAVRDRILPEPRLAIVGTRVSGTDTELTADAVLPPDPGMIEVSFAALTFTERDRVRYRMRLSPEAPWSEPFERPAVQLYNPPAGEYAIEIAASRDGEHWSAANEVPRFVVDAPIHQRVWFWALIASAVAGLGYGLHRARMAVRERLSQQRLRIAMDLHDDLGSGLGSIGLVADLLARPEFAHHDARRMAHDIRRTASQLGDSLRSLVWTLRDDRDSLESLGVQLADRAARLLPGTQPKLVTEFPDPWPSMTLSLAVRRNLQLIAQEALHNAVKHATATRVVLALAVVGSRGVLSVEDDGVGGVGVGTEGAGMGLRNLRRRAEEIGAELSIRRGRGGKGTCVEVVFDPAADDRRLGRRAVGTSA